MTKSGVRFFFRATEDPFFCTPNHWKWPFLGAKNWVFRRQNQKTDTTFCRQLYPKMVDETLVSYEYHYWVSFAQILKMAYFMLIFGRFPLIKSQNQNPMMLSVNFWYKTSIFGVWSPCTQRQLVFLRGRVTKMNFAFLGTPYWVDYILTCILVDCHLILSNI